jgi:hypothetical protein
LVDLPQFIIEFGAEAAGAGWASTAEKLNAKTARRLQRLTDMMLSFSDVACIAWMTQHATQFQHPHVEPPML